MMKRNNNSLARVWERKRDRETSLMMSQDLLRLHVEFREEKKNFWQD